MEQIGMQEKTKVLPGQIEAYWFENESIGLPKTLFHRITLPLDSFDSGLDYEEQPISTSIILDWYELGLDKPEDLDRLDLAHVQYPEAEGSIYIGGAHNWCVVNELLITKLELGSFSLDGTLCIEFENEGVAKNEQFKFQTSAEFVSA